ncbi:MAG: phytoene/squalene synthase family protein [Ectothiorhodospiraceae bacterium]|nr:phytoene/squalene synthase family protein [Ectothiorhodospiraceae bacterium]MCH8503474.1 phytoene/squalene synthase family protein [Ectothiorhodospiraceae bacterium]
MDAVSRQSQQSIEQGSRSFAAAARLFDAQTRDSASLLYAWCRHCDDVIDGQVLGFAAETIEAQTARERLARLRHMTDAAYQGETVEDPVFQAFQRVVQRHHIPRQYPLDLLEGFRMDVEQTRYESLQDTLRYSYHVAGVVGVMMALVMGVRDRPTLDRACDLGLGFQLTNIARDVREDALIGRCYLPAAWCREEGLALEDLAHPDAADAVSRLTARLVEEAEPYYASAMIGIRQLPFRSAWAIAAARNVYREIGMQLKREGRQAVRQRAVTTPARKRVLAGYGGLQALVAVSIGRMLPEPPRRGLWNRPSADTAQPDSL